MSRSVYSVYWADIAHKDLEGIVDYIALESVDNALNILYRIKEKAESLITFPERGRIVPELQFHNIENYRELIQTPWRIIYRIDTNKVYVIAIFDGRRNIEDILLERLIKYKL
jgi:toxin ParE1/3/4